MNTSIFELLSDNAHRISHPGSVKIFFRNLTAILIILILLRWSGCWSFATDIKDTTDRFFSVNPLFTDPARLPEFFSLLLIMRAVMIAIKNRLLWNTIRCSELDKPDSSFYRFAPIPDMIEGIIASVTYIYYFVFMLFNIASLPDRAIEIAVLLSSVHTFSSILYDNYLTYRTMLEKTHMPTRAANDKGDDKDHKNWWVS